MANIYVDFRSKASFEALTEQGIVCSDKNTILGYDEDVGALQVMAKDTYDAFSKEVVPDAGRITMLMPSDAVTMDDCPYFAMKVKLAKADTGFGAFIIKTDAKPSWRGFPYWEGYRATTDWQVVFTRVDKKQNPLFTGSWLGAMAAMVATGTPVIAGETIAWVEWAGVFPSLAEAYAYDSQKVEATNVFPVKETLPIEDAAARVNNNLTSPMTKIPSECCLVREYDHVYTFAHHGGLAIFKGKLYASYSRGLEDEDAPGQHMVVCSMPLDDFGNWSEPTVVGPAILAADGIHQTNIIAGWLHSTGDRLYAYYMDRTFPADAWDADGEYIRFWHPAKVQCRAAYTEDGVHWSEPLPVNRAANESPRQSLTGHWFAGSGNHLLYSDEVQPHMEWGYVGPTDEQIADAIARGAGNLPECSWYQTDDYVIHHMIRSSSGYFWMTNSYDNGKTFTDIYPTNFTGDDAMPNFGRLPDGRYYFVGSTNGDNARFPLQLFVSKDGYNFDTGYVLRNEPYILRHPGFAKGGGYGYPEVRFDDVYMYVLYSKNREVMEMTRVKLSDI